MKDMKNDNVRKIAKKGLTVGLCAVLTGGVIFGTVDGVGRLTGWKQTENVSAAAENRVELLKTESKKSKDDSKESEAEETTRVKGSLDVSGIVEEAMPFVVSITTKSLQEVQDYYGFFFGQGQGYAPAPQQEVQGSGSGIIIGKNEDQLLVVTNNHVVEGANTVSVSFIDGSSYEAKIRGTDSDKDLAVVGIPLADIDSETMEKISVASIGNSDDLKVGEQVIAIGNAMGYGQSVTTGIVSAKNRRMDDDTVISADNVDEDDGVNLIQTDAAINPGNSGGALLNMNGEVVGINSAKLASTNVEGMCYAIAISDVSDVLEDLMNETPREKVEGKHGVLGVMVSNVSEEAAKQYGIPEGAFVSEVTEGGAAEAAGIKKNYVITRLDGKRVHNKEELVDRLEYYEPGEEVEVTVEVMDSEGYQEKVVTVTLQESTEDADSEENAPDSQENGESSEDDPDVPEEEIEDMPSEDDPVIEDDPDVFDEWAAGGDIPDIREFFSQWR